MTAHVLMNKKTGDLLLGYRICFLDQNWIKDLTPPLARGGTQIVCLEHDDWIIEHSISDLPWFFNRNCEQWFTNLGEL